jgi:hypothetical protein
MRIRFLLAHPAVGGYSERLGLRGIIAVLQPASIRTFTPLLGS